MFFQAAIWISVPKGIPRQLYLESCMARLKAVGLEMHAEPGDISSQKIRIKSLSDGRLRYLEGKVGPGIRRLKQDPLFPAPPLRRPRRRLDPGSLVRCSDTYG